MPATGTTETAHNTNGGAPRPSFVRPKAPRLFLMPETGGGGG